MLYKLTDQDGFTRKGKQNECLWGPGVKHTSKGPHDKRIDLCTNSYIHCYENPLVAVFMNSQHENLNNPILWEAKGFVSKRNGQLKAGCFSLTTIKKIELPVLTANQRIRAAIYIALEYYKEPKFKKWAENWLNNKDRSENAAANAAANATDAANAAYSANAAYAANAAINAANAAAYAAADAAYSTARAANAAAYAAVYAADSTVHLQFNLIKILRRVVKEEVSQ